MCHAPRILSESSVKFPFKQNLQKLPFRKSSSSRIFSTGDKHSETGGPARLPAQVSGRWGHINLNSVQWGKFFFYWADQSRQGRIKISCTCMTSNEGPGRDPLYKYSISPHLPQFQQSAWATPLWSLWLALPSLNFAHFFFLRYTILRNLWERMGTWRLEK